MTATSRIIEEPLSGIAREHASDIEIAETSGLAVDVSSMLETVTRGGLYVPVLLSGPTVSDITATTARISWELDPSGPIGYHRVRHRRTDDGEWTVTEFTAEASYSAVVDLAGLPSGTETEYQVQSCHYGDGTLAFAYAPDPADTFETEAEDIIFSGFEAVPGVAGTITVRWTTNIATRRKLKWRPRDSSGDWTWTNLTKTYQLTQGVPTTMQNIPGKQFELYPYSITAGGYDEWNSMWYINVSAEGEITILKEE